MSRTSTALLALAVLAFFLVAFASGAAAQSRTHAYSFSGSDHGWIGVSVQDVSKKLIESKKLKTKTGAYVSDVSDDSPAEKAGIVEGDVIVKFDGRTIDDRDELVSAVRRTDPGEEVAVVVERKGETKTLTATVGEPESPHAMTFTVPRTAPHPRLFGTYYWGSGARLGMELQTLGKQLAEYFDVPGNRGVLVASVEKKGAAATAGVKAGDIIVRVNRNTVRDVDDVLEEVREADADSVPLEVVRKGKPVNLTMVLDREKDDVSEWKWDGEDEMIDAYTMPPDGAFDKKEFSRELREAMRELQRSLQDGARDLQRELSRSFRDS